MAFGWLVLLPACVTAPAAFAQEAPGYTGPCSGTSTVPTSQFPPNFFIYSLVTPGQNGAGAASDKPGNPGTGGSNGADANYATQSYTPFHYIGAITTGGDGGNGSNAGGLNGDIDTRSGGQGGVGGSGGNVNIIVNLNVVSQDALPPNFAVCGYSAGGAGGETGLPTQNLPATGVGTAASAGAAGSVSISVLAGSEISSPYGGGIAAEADGGAGGAGINGTLDSGISSSGTDGGNGAPGGDVTVTLGNASGTVPVTISAGAQSAVLTYGLEAVSIGGDGGNGGNGEGGSFDGATGGNGGSAAPGGTVAVTLYPGASITMGAPTGVSAPGILALSAGGIGGTGGNGSSAGSAGPGADGGSVAVILNGTVTTAGDNSPAVIAESLGGVGANGGRSGTFFGPNGGAGSTGGDGGSVTVTAETGTFSAAGVNSDAIEALSIGGGGGTGGDAAIGIGSVGGNGAIGANGGPVTADNAAALTTAGDRSAGILAQSIGGGGGNAGNASGVLLTIGGGGGGGGNAAEVDAANTGTVTTSGVHAPGLLLQSIGGGGGKGGAAYDFTPSVGLAVAVALGGTGGAGGAGATVGLPAGQSATNAGVIQTLGSDADGILAQSIGGGGGAGGSSAATAFALGAGEDIPAISISDAQGGDAGAGSNGGLVTIVNSGMIATSGAGSRGIVAQSIGGGGGRGGDASATSVTAGQDNPVNLAVSVAMGGASGQGGDGGSLSLTNLPGLIVTTGGDADGLLAQSIGGGGGAGGGSDGVAKNYGSDNSLTTAISLGARGGSGGTGGAVTLLNGGSILTLGDGGSGLTAQSIGGGGGRAGGAAGNAGSGTFSATVLLGGSGGSGGSASTVSAGNAGAILTYGNNASGIIAQSIGGGGGIAGKAASSLSSSKSTGDGGNGPNAAATLSALSGKGAGAAGDYVSQSELVMLANALLGNSDFSGGILSPLGDLASSAGSEDDEGDAESLTVKLAIGGSGGGGGGGGSVTANNTGTIATTGKLSDGIVAQSIGGGGGIGGAANTSASVVSADNVSASLALGGANGVSGAGGDVTVNNLFATGIDNLSGTEITTTGSMSIGIIAQSIGGGGGLAGLSGASTALLNDNGKTPVLTIGGSDDAGGDGNAVTVLNSGQIVTMSHDAAGIVAQSIGGGGGLIRTLATDLDTGGGAMADGGADDFALSLQVGGHDGASGDSDGQILVTNAGQISTAGRNAYGIVAQSIGGGGGLVLGGQPTGNDFFVGPLNGDANEVTVEESGGITTSGAGAIGIVAQSIGGGGVLAGDTGESSSYTQFPGGTKANGEHDGNGGAITVNVAAGTDVATTGANAPAILAQSIGGGGGFVVDSAGAFIGTIGGQGDGGSIFVNAYGTVSAAGPGSVGIVAESVGQDYGQTGSSDKMKYTETGGAPISIYLSGALSGGTTVNGDADSAPAVRFDGGGTSTANPNSIYVAQPASVTTASNSADQNTDATAIYSSTGYTEVANYGSVTGGISLDNDGGNGWVINNVTGLLRTTEVRLGTGTLTNAGTIDIGGRGAIADAEIEGNFVQTSTGKLLIDADFRHGKADRLLVTGNADLAGSIVVNQLSLHNRPLEIVQAGGTLDYEPGLTVSQNLLVGYVLQPLGNTIELQPEARFALASAGFNETEQSVARSLQRSFDSDSSAFDSAWQGLTTNNDSGAYKSALDSLSGQGLGGITVGRYEASRLTAANLYDCQGSADGGALPQPADCVAFRSEGSGVSRAASGSTLGYGTAALTLRLNTQKQVAPGWFVAGSLGYELGRISGGSAVSGSDQAGLAGLGVIRQQGPLLLSAAVDFGYGAYDTSRLTETGTAPVAVSGRLGAEQAGLHLQAAYPLPFDRLDLSPYLAFDTIYVRTGGYDENGGSPFALSEQAAANWFITGSPGIALDSGFDLPDGATIRVTAHAGAMLVGNNSFSRRAGFIGDEAAAGTFLASTSIPPAMADLGIDVGLVSSRNLDVDLAYNGDVGSNYAANSGTLRLAYKF